MNQSHSSFGRGEPATARPFRVRLSWLACLFHLVYLGRYPYLFAVAAAHPPPLLRLNPSHHLSHVADTPSGLIVLNRYIVDSLLDM
ncbi:hypothetical protein LZ31DRAFT_96995 [Colletotrichum somersetense]|nr:hypothetical protein LZ31DRAFT_96995 [Colletotrichum somersetense]